MVVQITGQHCGFRAGVIRTEILHQPQARIAAGGTGKKKSH